MSLAAKEREAHSKVPDGFSTGDNDKPYLGGEGMRSPQFLCPNDGVGGELPRPLLLGWRGPPAAGRPIVGGVAVGIYLPLSHGQGVGSDHNE